MYAHTHAHAYIIHACFRYTHLDKPATYARKQAPHTHDSRTSTAHGLHAHALAPHTHLLRTLTCSAHSLAPHTHHTVIRTTHTQKLIHSHHTRTRVTQCGGGIVACLAARGRSAARAHGQRCSNVPSFKKDTSPHHHPQKVIMQH